MNQYCLKGVGARAMPNNAELGEVGSTVLSWGEAGFTMSKRRTTVKLHRKRLVNKEIENSVRPASVFVDEIHPRRFALSLLPLAGKSKKSFIHNAILLCMDHFLSFVVFVPYCCAFAFIHFPSSPSSHAHVLICMWIVHGKLYFSLRRHKSHSTKNLSKTMGNAH